MQWSIPIFWFVLGIILLAIEMFTFTFILLWIGMSAIIVGIVAVFIPSIGIQLLIFSLSSLFFLTFTRPLTRKWRARSPNLQSGVYALIGKPGVALSRFGETEVGEVKVGGEIWNARSISGMVQEGEPVIVYDVQGVTLIVGKEKEEL